MKNHLRTLSRLLPRGLIRFDAATTPALRHLHTQIKRTLDPRHLLNPGKYL